MRRDDHVGTLLDTWDDDEITELAPLATALEWQGHEGATVPVHLQARVNEVGVLELYFVSRDERQRWKLEFNVRSCSAPPSPFSGIAHKFCSKYRSTVDSSSRNRVGRK